MSDTDAFLPRLDTSAESGLVTLGEVIPQVVRQYSSQGAFGIIAIDCGVIRQIERNFGDSAREQAMATACDVIYGSIGARLDLGDLVVCGETGRNEIVVLLFRDVDDVDFYSKELPELQRVLVAGLDPKNQRIGYPHLKSSPSLHVGIATSLRNPTHSAQTQIRNAVEEARRDAELNERISARRRRQQLFELVIAGRVRSVYEPIVDVKTHTVFGYEALARGPEGTALYSAPALFSSATNEDLLFQLDCLCRRSGLDGARDFPADAKLFLNIRPTTIFDPGFRATALRQTLEGCGLQPSDVVLEISEQESISNFEIFREIRDYYGNLGFQIAMDDVGTGYASLESVIELSPEFIKVDRAFVAGIDQDPNRQQLLAALQTVADQIGARIIGEGLDTLEELETLGRLEIPFGQGWLFGKPHPLRTDT
jgi:EAL domain-containing protein (putative c-di-GMP-specific phosphodiesterase class I)